MSDTADTGRPPAAALEAAERRSGPDGIDEWPVWVNGFELMPAPFLILHTDLVSFVIGVFGFRMARGREYLIAPIVVAECIPAMRPAHRALFGGALIHPTLSISSGPYRHRRARRDRRNWHRNEDAALAVRPGAPSVAPSTLQPVRTPNPRRGERGPQLAGYALPDGSVLGTPCSG